MHLFYDFLGPKMISVILKQACGGFFQKNREPVINISWLKNEQVMVCFFTLESPYPYFCCNLRHNVMPYMYSEMQNKLSKTRDSPLESMGQIISSRCPSGPKALEGFKPFRSFVTPSLVTTISSMKGADLSRRGAGLLFFINIYSSKRIRVVSPPNHFLP